MSILRKLSLRPLWRNRKGVASIEFAMIAPVMVMMFMGIVEFSQAITVDRRVNQVASSTADLIARTDSTTTAELGSIMDVVDVLVRPYSATPMGLTVSNVIASTSNATNTVVCWSYNHQGGVNTYNAGDSYTLPSGVVEAGESVVVVEVQYAYTPLIFSYFLSGTINFNDKFYLKPRLSSSIEFDSQKCTPPA
ncbi:MAG: TadE/TadG family type IV pilus assembly protein [Pseudomonadota bacterium]